jgi:hypothetical protein
MRLDCLRQAQAPIKSREARRRPLQQLLLQKSGNDLLVTFVAAPLPSGDFFDEEIRTAVNKNAHLYACCPALLFFL